MFSLTIYRVGPKNIHSFVSTYIHVGKNVSILETYKKARKWGCSLEFKAKRLNKYSLLNVPITQKWQNRMKYLDKKSA